MALQHLRSNTASKRPTAGSMSDGQLAINTNATSPGLFFKDAGGALIKIGPVHVGTSAPNSVPAGSSGNAIGEQWLDTSGGGYVFKVWDGTAWRSETGQFVDVAGDTMTGNLTISGADLIMSNGEIVAESGSASTPSITFTGDLNTGFYKPAADKLAISTGGTSRVIIDDSGNVGIGTSSPSETLTISGTTQDVARIKTSAVNAKLYFEASATTSNNYIQCTGDELLAVVNGGERLRIDSSGNVGIGTSDPSQLLEIASTAPNIRFTDTVDGHAEIDGNAASLKFNADKGNEKANSTITFAVDNSEKVRITSGGDVGIGISNPSSLLRTQGSKDHVGTTPNSSSYDVNFVSNNAGLGIGSSNGIPSIQGYGSGTAFNIALCPNAGNVGIGTTNPQAKLDVNGKAIVGDIPTRVNENSYDLQVQSAGNAELKLQAGATSTSYLAFGTTSNALATGFAVNNNDGDLRINTGNTERMRIDSSGRVGIGTSSPASLLHISSTVDTALKVQAGFAVPTIELLRGNSSVFGGDATYDYRLKNEAGIFTIQNGVNSNINDLLTIDNNGNVGIGTTDPERKLEIAGSGGAASVELRLNATDGGERQITFVGPGSNTHTIKSTGTSSNSLTFAQGSTERLRIDSSGRLLVGTSSSPIVDSNSAIVIKGSTDGTYSRLILARNDSATTSGNTLGLIQGFSSDGGDQPAAAITFAADSDHAVDDKPGRLVFSTTAAGASSPTERMRIRQNGAIDTLTASGSSLLVRNGTTAANEVILGCVNGATVLGNGTSVFVVRGDGDCENINNSYGAFSDIKLKENIVDANSQWNDLKALRVRNYNFKPDTGYSTHTQIGLIAQEVESVSPGLVGESIDEETGESTKSVNYSVLYMKAVKALQEAMERIEVLEQRLTDAGL